MAVRLFWKFTVILLAFYLTCLLFYVFWQTSVWYGGKRVTNGSLRRSEEPEDHKKPRGKQFNLIIISQGRSGSSFLGQLYNQHSEVLYFYEPFHALQNVEKLNTLIGNTTRKYNNLATMFLSEILDCRFKASEYLRYLAQPRPLTRFSSRVSLQLPPFFCQPEVVNSSLHELRCRNLKPSELNTVCKTQYRVTAVKVLEHRIMGKSIDYLKPLFKNKAAYVNKIVYLVRDPRAVISSMWHSGWIRKYVNHSGEKVVRCSPKDEQFVLYVKRMCNQVKGNLQSIKNPPNWLKGRFKLLRYEDLVSQPQKITKKLFRFVDLAIPNGMEIWLYRHMHFGGATLGGKEGAYSIEKNSTITLCKWRLEAPMEMVKVIEDHCGQVMDDLGYLPTRGSSEIQSRVDIPLFTRTVKDELQQYSCS